MEVLLKGMMWQLLWNSSTREEGRMKSMRIQQQRESQTDFYIDGWRALLINREKYRLSSNSCSEDHPTAAHDVDLSKGKLSGPQAPRTSQSHPRSLLSDRIVQYLTISPLTWEGKYECAAGLGS
jgi:hypothetical protein